MLKVTLDTNCIIDLEESRPNAAHLRRVINAWRAGRIRLGVVAIAASERQPGGAYSRDFSAFENKLASACLAGVEHLLPMAYWDVVYWDHALWSDDDMVVLEKKIHEILFPGSFFDAPSASDPTWRAWRNQKCDVQAVWAHIHHKWDVFVTSDGNFHGKATKLVALGAGTIANPERAARLCVT